MKTNHASFIHPAGGSTPRGLVNSLLKFGSVAELRAAAPLPVDTERLIDQAVVKVGRERLTLVSDLLSMGLTYNLPNWLSVPTLYWEKIGEAGSAKRTMVPKARGERQIMDREGQTIPIFCTWDDFSFDVRELAAAERVGAPLDTTHTEQATRNVNEAHEDCALNGGPTIAGNTVYGILNEPNVNTMNFSSGEAWTAVAHDGEDILGDVGTMIDGLQADKKYGPYYLYVNAPYGRKLMTTDFKANSALTIMQRLEETGLTVRIADKMPANTVAMVQMTSDVVDIVVGQQPTPVSWQDGSGWETFFVVLSCLVPRVKADIDGNSGIIVGTPS